MIIWRPSVRVSDPDLIQTDPDSIQINSGTIKTVPDRLIVKLREDPSISRFSSAFFYE